jgi:hypothetical protein
MAPILGIWASSAAPSKQSSYESIATVTVGSGGSSTISFTSIPSTYTHLQVRGIGRVSVTGSGTETLLMRFNTDTAANYSVHNVYGNGTSASAGGAANTTSIGIYDMPRTGELANSFGSYVIDILDYGNTNKYKTSRALAGMDTNGSTYAYIGLYSGNWRNTNAITQIDLTSSGGNFVQYSSFALFGIKG